MAARANRQAIEAEDWVKLSKGLFVYCRRLGLSVEDAADISQQAICRVFEKPEWDQGRYPTMRKWLGSIVNGLVINLRRNVARNTETLALDENTASEPSGQLAVARRAPLPDEVTITTDRARKAVSRVLELVKGSPLAEAIVMLHLEDIDAPRDQAEALKVDVEKVYRAREKIAAAAAQALKGTGGLDGQDGRKAVQGTSRSSGGSA